MLLQGLISLRIGECRRGFQRMGRGSGRRVRKASKRKATTRLTSRYRRATGMSRRIFRTSVLILCRISIYRMGITRTGASSFCKAIIVMAVTHQVSVSRLEGCKPRCSLVNLTRTQTTLVTVTLKLLAITTMLTLRCNPDHQWCTSSYLHPISITWDPILISG